MVLSLRASSACERPPAPEGGELQGHVPRFTGLLERAAKAGSPFAPPDIGRSSSFSSRVPFLPVANSFPRRVEVADRDGLAFVADAVNGHDATAFHEEPQHARVQLAHVPEFKQAVAKRLGQRLAVILAVAQLRQSGQHHCKVVRVVALSSGIPAPGFPGIRLVKLYREFHWVPHQYWCITPGRKWPETEEKSPRRKRAKEEMSDGQCGDQ